MTWVRAGQLTGEIAEDHTGYSGESTFTRVTSVKFSGGASYRQSTGYLAAPTGLDGLDASIVRCHMMFRHNGTSYPSNFLPVLGISVEGAPLVFGYTFNTSQVRLVAGYPSGQTAMQLLEMGANFALAQHNVWVSVGLVARIAASGGFVSFYLEGERVARWEGVAGDTRVFRSGQTVPRVQVQGAYAGGRPTVWGVVGLHTAWHDYPYVDDFYVDVWEGSGAPVDKAPSLRRYLVDRPLASGDVSQWSVEGAASNVLAVNEAVADEDATFVKASYPEMLELFSCDSVVIPEDHAVRAVIPSVRARKTDTGVDSTVKVVLSDGVDMVKSEEKALGAAYRTVWERWKLAPNEDPWTQGHLDEMQIGMESSGVFDDEE